MRPPVASEVVLFARALMVYPQRRRLGVATGMLAEVDLAERQVRDTGQVHPLFGDGSLMARCHRAGPVREPMADDRDFLQSLNIACIALLGHSRP